MFDVKTASVTLLEAAKHRTVARFHQPAVGARTIQADVLYVADAFAVMKKVNELLAAKA